MKLISCWWRMFERLSGGLYIEGLGSASTRVCRLARGRIGKVGVLRLRLGYGVRWGEK